MGSWLSWESAAFATRRPRVRIPSSPFFIISKQRRIDITDKNKLKAINSLTEQFFKLFDNRSGKPNIAPIYDLFTPDGIIRKCLCDKPEVYSVKEFAKSREGILSSGELTDFFEEEVHHKTDEFGNIAQRFCIYRKSGVLNGVGFTAYGIKTIQFVNTTDGFRICAAAWDDEREGFSINDALKDYGFPPPHKTT